MQNTMNLLNILLGFVILLTGRQLFWLFVGILGFLAGASLVQEFVGMEPVWMVWVLALLLGLIGALLAIFLQRIAVGVAGFVAGWVFMTNLAATFGWSGDNLAWVLSLLGGLLGAVLIMMLYDPALIFLSSIVGATTVVQNFNLGPEPWIATAALVILVLVGVSVQYRFMLAERGAVPV